MIYEQHINSSPISHFLHFMSYKWLARLQVKFDEASTTTATITIAAAAATVPLSPYLPQHCSQIQMAVSRGVVDIIIDRSWTVVVYRLVETSWYYGVISIICSLIMGVWIGMVVIVGLMWWLVRDRHDSFFFADFHGFIPPVPIMLRYRYLH